jgi:hypothetical protein
MTIVALLYVTILFHHPFKKSFKILKGKSKDSPYKGQQETQ